MRKKGKMSRTFPDLKRYQQSVFYYSDMVAKDDPVIKNRPNFYFGGLTHLLIDDIGSEVISFSFRNNYTVRIKPENTEFEKIVSNAFSNDRDHLYFQSGPLIENTRNFFQSTAKILASYGECIYEFVDLLDQETGELKAFEVSLIEPQTLKRKRKKWVQYVPKAIAVSRNIDRYIPVESERLLIFRLPEQFHKKWMQIMKNLASTEDLIPEFGFPSFGAQQNKVPFDFNQHHILREQFVARLTNEIGWNMRKYPHDGMLEYYWFHRFLKFERFKIELRISFLNTLIKV